jgi:hypothetical protein
MAPWTPRTVQGRRLLPVYSTVSDEWCVRKRYRAVEAGGVEAQILEKGVGVVRRNGNAHGALVSGMVVEVSTLR